MHRLAFYHITLANHNEKCYMTDSKYPNPWRTVRGHPILSSKNVGLFCPITKDSVLMLEYSTIRRIYPMFIYYFLIYSVSIYPVLYVSLLKGLGLLYLHVISKGKY